MLISHTVELQSSLQCCLDVVCFDLVPQILMLLQNRDIMIADNLAIGIKDPLKPYTSPNDTLDEALSGSVYREAYDQ
jgi:hypothetical protein